MQIENYSDILSESSIEDDIDSIAIIPNKINMKKKLSQIIPNNSCYKIPKLDLSLVHPSEKLNISAVEYAHVDKSTNVKNLQMKLKVAKRKIKLLKNKISVYDDIINKRKVDINNRCRDISEPTAKKSSSTQDRSYKNMNNTSLFNNYDVDDEINFYFEKINQYINIVNTTDLKQDEVK